MTRKKEPVRRIEIESSDILEAFKALLHDQQYVVRGVMEAPLPAMEVETIFYDSSAGPIPGEQVPGRPELRRVGGSRAPTPGQARMSADLVMHVFGMALESLRKEGQTKIQNRIMDSALRQLTEDPVFDRVWRTGRERFLPSPDPGESEPFGVNVTGWMDSWMRVRYDLFEHLVGVLKCVPVAAAGTVDAAFMLYYRKLERNAKLPAAIVEVMFEDIRRQLAELADEHRPAGWPKEYGM